MTPRARRLAELLAARPGRRTPLAELWALLDAADPASAGSVERRRLLAEAVDELADAGVLRPSRGRDPGRPALPTHVDRLDAPPARPAPGRVEPWHPELGWAAERRLTAAQEAQLRAVSRWLFGPGGRAAPAPLRERALEITGDEKAFDGGLVADGTLALDVLRAYRVVLPLHTERVGDGPVCLVVENADTVDSLRRVLAADPGPVGRVAWGAGTAFSSSVLSLRSDPPGAIRYFGDLDAAGLRIPAGASELAVRTGLPPVRPAAGLYAALLEHGVPGRSSRPVPADRAAGLVAWLEPEHRDPARARLVAGERLAQEAVGVAGLAASDGWRAGLG